MDIFDLVATLSLDTSEYEKELTGAQKNAQSAGSGIGGVLSGAIGGALAGGGVTAALGAVSAGVSAVTDAVGTMGSAVADGTQALVSNVAGIAEYGDNIDKMSQKLGISAEAYQEWDAVMQHSGSSIESLKPAMKTLAVQAEKGSDAFERLGISEEEIANLSQEDLFSRVIAGLQEMGEGTERTYVASQLLGRGVTELGALLNTSAKDTQAMKDRVHELGGVMSDEAVKASAGFQDSLQDLTTGFDSIKRNLLSDFLPSMTEVMDGLTDILAGDADKGIEEMSKGIEDTINNLSELMPRFTRVAVPLIQALADGILQNIPVIIPAITDLVSQLGDTILQYLPMLVDVGESILVELANGISEALPELVPTITEVVLNIIDILIQNAPLLGMASIQLMNGLTQGLIAALPILLETIPQLVTSYTDMLITYLPQIILAIQEITLAVADALIQNMPLLLDANAQIITAIIGAIIASIPTFLETLGTLFGNIAEFWLGKLEDAAGWGKDLMKNFIDGIKSRFGDVKSVLSELGELIASLIGFSEPDIGPLSNFHTYAPDMMELFAKGIRDNTQMLQDQLAQSFNFEPEIAGAVNTTPNVVNGGNRGSQSAIGPLTVILELDKMEFGRAVYEVNNAETQRVGLRIVNV